jgi:hypothetical protein
VVRQAWIDRSEVVSLENVSAMSDRRYLLRNVDWYVNFRFEGSSQHCLEGGEIDPARLMARYREIVDGYGVVTDK